MHCISQRWSMKIYKKLTAKFNGKLIGAYELIHNNIFPTTVCTL